MFLYELYKVFLILLNVVMIWFVLNLNFCFISIYFLFFFYGEVILFRICVCMFCGFKRGRWFFCLFKVVFGKGVC